jgi:hypothetical protein
VKWDGSQFIDVTPAPKAPLEPSIVVRRAGGRIKCVHLGRGGWPGMPKDVSAGSQLELDAERFEEYRRAGLVRRFEEPRYLCRVVRPWKTGLQDIVPLAVSEMARRRNAGEVTLADSSGATTNVITAAEWMEPASFACFVTTRLDVTQGDGYIRHDRPLPATVHIEAGQIVELPRGAALRAEARDQGTILFPDDRVIVNGVEVRRAAEAAAS